MPAVFTAGAGSLTLSRDAELSNRETWGRVQARNRTQDGTFQAADKGVEVRQFLLAFRHLTSADKTNLENFVSDYSIGSTIDVTFTDHDGNRWIVRILDDRLNWTENWNPGEGSFDVTLDLEVIRAVDTS